MSRKASGSGRPVSVFRAAGLILLTLLLSAVVFLAVVPLTETDPNEIVNGSESWMAALPDDRPLNEIALPGTHDSATQYGGM